MASLAYTRYLSQLADGTRNWETDDIRAMLVKAAYTPLTSHDFVSSPAAQELSGGTYARQACSGMTVTDAGTTGAQLTVDNILWAALTAGSPTEFVAVVLFAFVTNDSDSVLAAYLELATPITTSGVDVEVEPPSGVALLLVNSL